MKIALMGKGKTGGEILNLYPKEKIVVFDSKKRPTLKSLTIAMWSFHLCQEIPSPIHPHPHGVSNSSHFRFNRSLRQNLLSQLSKKKNAIGSQALIFLSA